MTRRAWFLCVLTVVLNAALALAQMQEKVLYTFGSYPEDGAGPVGSMVMDHAGNLYGVTMSGGLDSCPLYYACGIVYEISPNNDGTWSERILYSFCQEVNCSDGGTPMGGLIIDDKGNLYGTTSASGGVGGGTVFELSPSSLKGGTWTYTVLHAFCSLDNCADGASPRGTIVFDAAGNLYGTTASGSGRGTVFELSPGNGGWTETVLYIFCPNGGFPCPDGAFPQAGVTLDKFGNIYGTTLQGGANEQEGGTIFKLTPGANGWTETVLLAFSEHYKGYLIGPSGGVSLDPAGNLLTTFYFGLKDQGGIVMQKPDGAIEHHIMFYGVNDAPTFGLFFDNQHRVAYGSSFGGTFGPGNVFEVDKSGRVTVVYAFCQQQGCTDGSQPSGVLIKDRSGNMYGAAESGGYSEQYGYGVGVVYELTP